MRSALAGRLGLVAMAMLAVPAQAAPGTERWESFAFGAKGFPAVGITGSTAGSGAARQP